MVFIESRRYMRINTDEAIRWKLASDCEKMVHELYCFTKLPANGKSIYEDRWFEVRSLYRRRGGCTASVASGSYS